MRVDVALPLRVLGYPAPDMPATWIAHALDLDIIAQGPTAAAAAQTLREALQDMIIYRLSEGLTPVEWSPAAEELWAAAEATVGEPLERRHPPVRVLSTHVQGAPDEESTAPAGTRLIVTDRTPVRAAHAG